MAKKKLKRNGKNERDRDGRYHWEVTFRSGGRQCRRRIWAFDDFEVEQYIRKEKSEPAVRLTWDDALEAYLARRESSRTDDYLEDVTFDVHKCRDELGWHPMEISLRAMSDWLAAQVGDAEGQVTARTANKRLAHLKSIMRRCREAGVIADDPPWGSCPNIPHRARERLPIQAEKIDAYIACIEAPEARLPFQMILLTAERSGAILALRPKDDLGDRIVVRAKKRSRKERTILLFPEMRAILDETLALRAALESPPPTIFHNCHGTPWTRWAFRTHILRQQKKAGLDPRTPHELRHTMADLAADLGYARDMIAALLGHDSSESAEGYIHASPRRASVVQRHLFATFLQHLGSFSDLQQLTTAHSGSQNQSETECPKCGHKFNVDMAVALQHLLHKLLAETTTPR